MLIWARPFVSVLVVSLLAFAFGFVGSMPLLGPIAIMVVSRAVVGHFGEARRVAMGAAVIEGLYAGLAFFGFATLFVKNPGLLPYARCVTAVVLGVVGLQFLRWTPQEAAEKKETGRGAFALGFMTSFVNPAVFLSWAAAATAIYSRQLVPMTRGLAIPFGISAGLGIVGWNAVLLALMRRYHQKLPQRFLKWSIRTMGGVLMVLATSTAVGAILELTRG